MIVKYLVYKINDEYKFVFQEDSEQLAEEWARRLGGKAVFTGYCFSKNDLERVFDILKVVQRANFTGRFNLKELEEILKWK